MSRNYFEVADRRYNMDIDICGLSQDFLGYLVKSSKSCLPGVITRTRSFVESGLGCCGILIVDS